MFFNESIIVKNNDDDNICYVDNAIEDTVKDIAYEKLSIAEKKKVIFDLLERLKIEKRILDFYYSEDNYQFSFVYKDKSLGGIMLDDRHDKIFDIPIN